MNKGAVLSCLLSVCLGASLKSNSGHPLPSVGRIIGGEDAKIEETPYQVALEGADGQYCGGSIVGKRHVLTAVLCLWVPNIRVRVGSTLKNDGGEVYKVIKAVAHPRFSIFPLDYNIAILELDKDIALSDRAQIIKLSASEPAAGTRLRISGWGDRTDNDDPVDTLKVVDLPVISKDKCRGIYAGEILKVTDNMICAVEQGKGSCRGDIGGPAVAEGQLVGITSFGVGCNQPGFPELFTSVAHPEVSKFIAKYVQN